MNGEQLALAPEGPPPPCPWPPPVPSALIEEFYARHPELSRRREATS